MSSATFNDFQANFSEILQNVEEYMENIALIQSEVSAIGLESALSQAQNALDIALVEAEGLNVIQIINQITTEYNVVSDAELLATRQAFMLAGKAMETAQLVAQMREKTLGLFIAITEQRTNNVWGRIKQLSGGFKF